MKNTKRIICLALCILSVATLLCGCSKTEVPPEEPQISEESTTKEVKPEEPITIEESGKETTEKETTKKEETTTTKPYTPPSTTKPSTTKPSTTKPAPTKPQLPSTTKAPEKKPNKKPETTTQKQETTTKKPEPTTTKPATTEPKPYSCGKANHHCTTKEEHAFIVSLEEKGCPICSSHSCKSFYALDEWGNPCYDITRCPKYSEKKDPANTCEHCGREVGLGDNGTCVRFTVETKCPGCGKTVAAKTCHTH